MTDSPNPNPFANPSENPLANPPGNYWNPPGMPISPIASNPLGAAFPPPPPVESHPLGSAFPPLSPGASERRREFPAQAIAGGDACAPRDGNDKVSLLPPSVPGNSPGTALPPVPPLPPSRLRGPGWGSFQARHDGIPKSGPWTRAIVLAFFLIIGGVAGLGCGYLIAPEVRQRDGVYLHYRKSGGRHSPRVWRQISAEKYHTLLTVRAWVMWGGAAIGAMSGAGAVIQFWMSDKKT